VNEEVLVHLEGGGGALAPNKKQFRMETVRSVFATSAETQICYSDQTLQLCVTLPLLVTILLTLTPILYNGTVCNILPVFRELP